MSDKYELIIAEKPNAAKKISEALADKKVIKKTIGKVSYYELEHKGKPIVVACAVGHLFNLAEKNKKKGWTYPIFDYEWKPSYEVSKSALFTKPYVELIRKLAKDASVVTVACDFDIEGSTIGYNILLFVCGKKDGKRMKFSTLTTDELIESYENAMTHLDFPQIESGIARHSMDWLWGMNLSRALTLSVKSGSGMFKILSTGRVQGPTLKILVEKEKEIAAFKSTPYWEIELNAETKDKGHLNAWHKEDKFWDKPKAEAVMKKCKGKSAFVKDMSLKEFKQAPPFPFDLTSLQIEAYSVLGISPQRTLDYAQDLYSNGYISYPRTSSQKLPPSIGYKKILNSLAKAFSDECAIVLKTKLVPNEGKKEDAAHPAIYPTGELPSSLEDKKADLYELIVRRFFATFGSEAIRETATIELDVNFEIFIAKGTRTKVPGWHTLYDPFVKMENEELPKVNIKDEVKVKELNLYDKETKAPPRYTEASIIKEMEKLGIGTKATRSTILQNLFDRNYIDDKSIKVTDLGMKTVETLEKYSPEVLDVALTKKFEDEMDEIQEGKKKADAVVESSKKILEKALTNFKKHEKEIGKDLGQAAIETRDKESFVGKCPVCKEGELHMRSGKYGPFVACDKYDKEEGKGCKTTFPLPKNGKVKAAMKNCEICNFPMVLVFRAKRKPQEVCINLNCPKKKEEEERLKKLVEGKKCPNCSSQLVIKNGMYGPFLACPGYPKCKHIEKMPKPEV
jgi:DNA topoisomerase-1